MPASPVINPGVSTPEGTPRIRAVPADTLERNGRHPTRIGAPPRIREPLSGLQKRLEVAEVAVAQGVIVAEPLGEGGLQGRLDLRPGCRLIEATERKNAGEPDPGGPWHHAHMEFA